MTQPRTIIAIILAACAQPVLAGPVTFVERHPADPAAIAVTVDQKQLNRTLSREDLSDLIEAGRMLFDTRFTAADGAGRPMATQATIPTHFRHVREVLFQRASGPDANGCVSCHHDPVLGGAAGFVGNVFTSEGTESADFDNVDPQFSNERGSLQLFGVGLVELLAREMTADLQAQRRDALQLARQTGEAVTIGLRTKGVAFGSLTVSPGGTIDTSAVEGIDDDLVLRPFGHKGVITSLRMFAVTAMNAHFGMQAEERFGLTMTGLADFDGDGHEREFSPGQISAVVAFQATLPPPVEVPFDNPEWQAAAERGKTHFNDQGCAACHMPALPLASLKFADPGPNDTAGTLSMYDVGSPATYDLALLDWAQTLPRNDKGEVMVPLFSDLKRHVIADDRNTHFGNELLGTSFVPRDIFITTKLWGAADTGPYGHRADLTTLHEAILAHGGEAVAARDAYAAASPDVQADLITFLKTLRIPQ